MIDNSNTEAENKTAPDALLRDADYILQDEGMYHKVLEEELRELASLRGENSRLRLDNLQLKKENSQLKRMPLFVASVLEKFPNYEVYLRQIGNNQEYITQTSPQLYEQIAVGGKVAVNNTLSIVKTIGDVVDARVKIMELDEKPTVTFDDIGGLKDKIIEVREAVEYPLTRPEAFARFGVIPPKGVLLYGPPGTGKTLIAKAVANNAGVPFLRLAGSELVHKYIGEGAQLVRDLFTLARDLAEENNGVVVFIDEIDAVGSMRTNDGTTGSAEVQRTLMQLLAEMDGFNTRGNVRIMAATNRPDMLDAALLRPGRFDRLVQVPQPDAEARAQIFAIHTKKMREAKAIDKVNFDNLVAITDGFNGSQVEAVCREAGMIAIRYDKKKITESDFLEAVRKIKNEEQNGIADVMYS